MTCLVCQQSLSRERIEALELLGAPKNEYTCVDHSLVQKVQGIYSGASGISELLIVRSLGDGIDRSIDLDDTSERH
jgi:hypothetical protein